MKRVLLFVLLVTPVVSARAITIDTVPVGNLGNANDPATGDLYGGVSHAYGIGKYEVTVGQYTAFLNAVAATDTYSLYNTRMATDLNSAGIARSGASGSYSYSVIGSPNHPVTYVSWGDAARFANWLHNGQPSGAESTGTTETGAYTLNGAMSSSALIAVARNVGATWFIPTENEWYKAAYYQPPAQGGDSDSYWAYPMRTNSNPYSDQPPGSTPDNNRVGNFYQTDDVDNGYDDGFAVTGMTGTFPATSQNYLTDVGSYLLSYGPFGTFDQGGNAYEWNETSIDNTFRSVRGGSWLSGSPGFSATNNMRSSDAGSQNPTNEQSYLGFRMATVPEPSTIALTVLAFAALPTCRRKSIPHNRI